MRVLRYGLLGFSPFVRRLTPCARTTSGRPCSVVPPAPLPGVPGRGERELYMNTASISVEVREATDSSALVTIVCADGASTAALGSELHGPVCAFARTLPSVVAAKAAHDGHGVEFLITEPCYWTPQLPFLYELTLRGNGADGKRQNVCRQVGLRRLTPRRASLYWESERIVLRGTHASSLRPEMVSDVRRSEVALVIKNPSLEQCELADGNGVAIVADLRESDLDFDDILRLTIHPAVAIILIDGHQIYSCDVPRIPKGSPIAVAVYPVDDAAVSAQVPPAWCNVIAVDLESDTRPPSWLANCGKPVVAIRSGQAYADFYEARAACDRLQAELAPEFNLAGYFV